METPIRPMHKHYGRPVLISVDLQYSLFGDRAAMLAVPVNEFFGAGAYFFGHEVSTDSCGIIEYDSTGAYAVKSRYKSFHQATDAEIAEALKDSKCTPYFIALVNEIMEALAINRINEIINS